MSGDDDGRHDALPQDLEAERAVLGSMLLDPAACRSVLAVLTAADFYRDAHATVFRAIDRLAQDDENVDAAILQADLRATGALNRLGKGFVADILADTPTAANAGHYARIVHGLARKRDVILAADAYARASRNGHDDAAFAELTAARARMEAPADPSTAPVVEWDLRSILAEPPPDPPDEVVERLVVRSSVTVLCGPASSGKSWGLMQALLDLALGGGPFFGNPDIAVMPLRNDAGEPQERILWVFGSEDTERRVKFRLRAILDAQGRAGHAIPDGVFVVAKPPPGVSLGTLNGDRWLHELLDRRRPTQLVLDTVASLTTLDAGKAEEVVPFMRSLHAIRDGRGCNVYANHHTRKEGADPKKSHVAKADSMLGSQAWRSMADAVLIINARDGDTSDVTLRLVKSKDIDQPAPPFHAGLQNGLFRFLRWDDEEAAAPPTRPPRESKIQPGPVLALLEKHAAGVPLEGIYRPLGWSKASWFRHRDRVLHELRDRTFVVQGVLRLRETP